MLQKCDKIANCQCDVLSCHWPLCREATEHAWFAPPRPPLPPCRRFDSDQVAGWTHLIIMPAGAPKADPGGDDRWQDRSAGLGEHVVGERLHPSFEFVLPQLPLERPN